MHLSIFVYSIFAYIFSYVFPLPLSLRWLHFFRNSVAALTFRFTLLQNKKILKTNELLHFYLRSQPSFVRLCQHTPSPLLILFLFICIYMCHFSFCVWFFTLLWWNFFLLTVCFSVALFLTPFLFLSHLLWFICLNARTHCGYNPSDVSSLLYLFIIHICTCVYLRCLCPLRH